MLYCIFRDSVISISPPDSPCYPSQQNGGSNDRNGVTKRYSHRDTSRDTYDQSNVFNRLTANDVNKQAPAPEQGIVKPYSGNTNRFRAAPITLTHVAEGHSKAVLALDAYDLNLFTASKDRTAKIWDLTSGHEVASLAGHVNNVTRVKFCPISRLCFTVSSYYVNVWDLRLPGASFGRCLKTLW